VLVVAGVADELADGAADGAADALADATADALADATADALADATADALADALADATAAAHVAFVIVSFIKVTSPFRASARPLTVTPLAIVIDVRARMVPTKLEPDPSVAELVTCQKTLHGFAPLMSTTLLEDAVTRSDVAWKTQTEFGSFWPSSVSVSVRSSVAPPAV
jgi:hypothetical protein